MDILCSLVQTIYAHLKVLNAGNLSLCDYIESIVSKHEHIYPSIYTFVMLAEDFDDCRTGAAKCKNTKNKTCLKMADTWPFIHDDV